MIKTRVQSRTAPAMEKLANMSADEAAKFGPYGRGDKPCAVVCYGKRTEWRSRRAARFFYSVGAQFCAKTAEGERYGRIVEGLDDGLDVATDGQPERTFNAEPPPKDADRILAALREKKRMYERLMDAARANHQHEEAARYASLWNDCALEVIRLERLTRFSKAAS